MRSEVKHRAQSAIYDDLRITAWPDITGDLMNSPPPLKLEPAPRASYTCPRCHRESFNPHDIAHLYCGACHVFAEDLRDEPVTMFAHLTAQRLTKRDAFSLAALTLLESADNPHARLVHGIALNSFNPGEYVQHAWCEFPATATYDNGMQGPIAVVNDYSQLDARMYFIPRHQFYAQCGIRETKHFTCAEMIARVRAVGHDGPWSDSPKLPILSSVRSTSEE